jgi:hypothetical protein
MELKVSCEGFLSSTKHPDQIYGQPNVLSEGNQALFPADKKAMARS